MKIKTLVNKLIINNLHISCAESCTGGLLTSSIVSIPNASKILNESFITYSNQSKINILKVNEKTIERYGVVSENVVSEMVHGLEEITKSEINVAISGITGPTGETEIKPIGMVCFGFKIFEKEYSSTVFFGNIGRNNVRKKAVEYVINYLLTILN